MTTTDTSHEARCKRPGCTGRLRSPASITRGMSRDCDRKVRHAEAAAAKAGFSAGQLANASAAIRSGGVALEDNSLWSVPSSKHDGTRYATDGISCCCPAGANDRRCWHLIVAIVIDLAGRRRSSLGKAA